MKVFLDANILFSASDSRSATRRLLLEVIQFGAAWTSAHAWEEARRNLHVKRPVNLAGLDDLRQHVQVTHAFAPVPGVDLPEEDQPILSGAIGARCTHLWTSDRRHFGRFYGRQLQGVLVASSTMLADELSGKSGG